MEVLVSIALIIALVGVMYSFLFNLLDAREKVLEAAGQRRAATMLIERLEADLICCIAGDSGAGAGLNGDDSSITILTRSVAAGLAQQRAAETAAFADLHVSTFRFRSDTGELEVSRGVVGHDISSGSASAYGADSSYVLADSIFRIRFRYHDGTDWRQSFDSRAAGSLPRAVEVAVWFQTWPGEEPLEEPEEELSDDEALLEERLTYDFDAGFDEAEYAELSDLEVFDEPKPDRVRVIIIPDAAEEEEVDDEAL